MTTATLLSDALTLHETEFLAVRNLAVRSRREYLNDLNDLLVYLTNSISLIFQESRIQQRWEWMVDRLRRALGLLMWNDPTEFSTVFRTTIAATSG